MKLFSEIRLWSLWFSCVRRDNLSSPEFPRVASGCLIWPPGNSHSPLPTSPKKTAVNTGYQFLLHPIEIYKNSGVLLLLGACGWFLRLRR